MGTCGTEVTRLGWQHVSDCSALSALDGLRPLGTGSQELGHGEGQMSWQGRGSPVKDHGSEECPAGAGGGAENSQSQTCRHRAPPLPQAGGTEESALLALTWARAPRPSGSGKEGGGASKSRLLLPSIKSPLSRLVSRAHHRTQGGPLRGAEGVGSPQTGMVPPRTHEATPADSFGCRCWIQGGGGALGV